MRKFGTGSPLWVTVPSMGTISGPPRPQPAAVSKSSNPVRKRNVFEDITGLVTNRSHLITCLAARRLAAGPRVRRQIDVEEIDVIRDPGYPAVGVGDLHTARMLAGGCSRIELRVVRRRKQGAVLP